MMVVVGDRQQKPTGDAKSSGENHVTNVTEFQTLKAFSIQQCARLLYLHITIHPSSSTNRCDGERKDTEDATFSTLPFSS